MPLRSNVVRRSSISSEECTSAGRESFTSSYSRYPRSLPTAISWRTASYFSSKPVAATALLPFPKLVSGFSRELHRLSCAHCPHEMQRESPQWAMGGSESPERLSIFSVKPYAPCCVLDAAARLPACRALFTSKKSHRKKFATAPCTMNIIYRCRDARTRYPHNPSTLHA